MFKKTFIYNTKASHWLRANRRQVVKIISESLSQHDKKKHVVPTSLSVGKGLEEE
jgi:hypothetical protein